ncbi:hypothetical protein ACLOJK_005363 [Asimina triloba]
MAGDFKELLHCIEALKDSHHAENSHMKQKHKALKGQVLRIEMEATILKGNQVILFCIVVAGESERDDIPTGPNHNLRPKSSIWPKRREDKGNAVEAGIEHLEREVGHSVRLSKYSSAIAVRKRRVRGRQGDK